MLSFITKVECVLITLEKSMNRSFSQQLISYTNNKCININILCYLEAVICFDSTDSVETLNSLQ